MKMMLEITKEELIEHLSETFRGDLEFSITEMTPEDHEKILKGRCKICNGKCAGWRPSWRPKAYKVIKIF